jgi:hypothetical protein
MRKLINYINNIEGTMYIALMALCFWIAILDIILLTYILRAWFLK